MTIFYLEKSVNHYFNYVQVNELIQYKIDYYSGDDFFKSLQWKKFSKIFKFENDIKKVIKCVKSDSVSWSKCCYQIFVIFYF